MKSISLVAIPLIALILFPGGAVTASQDGQDSQDSQDSQNSSAESITLSLEQVDLVEALRALAGQAKINIVIEKEARAIKGISSVELDHVTLEQAFSEILSPHGLRSERRGEVWVVGPPPSRS